MLHNPLTPGSGGEALALRSAFVRGLSALTISIADVVGSAQWGLRPERPTIRNDPRIALDFLFHVPP